MFVWGFFLMCGFSFNKRAERRGGEKRESVCWFCLHV